MDIIAFFRLSSMITEQRKFLTGLLETSILGDTVPLSHTLQQVKLYMSNYRKQIHILMLLFRV